jgi:hypothetical protein
LPPGIHVATIEEAVSKFGVGIRRSILARRLERIHKLAKAAGFVRRFIVFGSFVTEKEEPNDVDIVLVMEDSFDVRTVPVESRLVFDHSTAQNVLGASIFWVRAAGALGGEKSFIDYWQTRRDGGRRGILEIQ